MIPLFRVNMSPTAKYAVAKVLESGYIGQGPVVERFEQKLTDVFGVRPLTTSGCTHALDLAYHMVHLSPGSHVLSTSMTCTATNTPLINRYCAIIWADIDSLTGNVDPESVDRALKEDPEIEAVVVCDWSGRNVDVKRIKEIVGPKHIPVIEDCAHVFSRHHDNYPDDWYSCYSFGPIKHLTTVNGGAIVVPPEQKARAELLRWYGLDRKKTEICRCSEDIIECGYKYHMCDVEASIGSDTLPYAFASVDAARQNAKFYGEQFTGLKHVVPPPPDSTSSWWLYMLKTPKREEFIEFMKKAGIMVNPAHRRNDIHTAFPKPPKPLVGVDSYDPYHCAIPVGFWVGETERDLIVEKVKEWDGTLGG
jgi:dTDP-4-amino-4,6-dideoxygalactose transaminase